MLRRCAYYAIQYQRLPIQVIPAVLIQARLIKLFVEVLQALDIIRAHGERQYKRNLRHIDVYKRQGLTFYGSNDGKSWEVIKEYTGLPMLAQEGTTPITNKDPIIQTYTFDNPVEISYLRVMATAYTKDDSGSGFYFQMSEVEAYGEPLEQQVEQLTITEASGSNDWPGHTADVL